MPKTLETETESLHLSRAAGPVFVLHASSLPRLAKDTKMDKWMIFSLSNSVNL